MDLNQYLVKYIKYDGGPMDYFVTNAENPIEALELCIAAKGKVQPYWYEVYLLLKEEASAIA